MMNPENQEKWRALLGRHYEQQILEEYSKYLKTPADKDSLLSYEDTKRLVEAKADAFPPPWFRTTVPFQDMWKVKEFIQKNVQYKDDSFYIYTIDGYCQLRQYKIQSLSLLNLDFPFDTGNGLLVLTSCNMKEEISIDWYDLSDDLYIDLELSNADKESL